MSRNDELHELAGLLRSRRWAALASVEEDGAPYASAVAYVVEPAFDGVLLHLSGLAPHTRNLLHRPEASLMVSAGDPGEGDPQTLPRVSLMGRVEALVKGGAEYDAARKLYLSRLPSAEPLFEFADFVLFRLLPTEARFVGGFARARSFSAAALREAAAIQL